MTVKRRRRKKKRDGFKVSAGAEEREGGKEEKATGEISRSMERGSGVDEGKFVVRKHISLKSLLSPVRTSTYRVAVSVSPIWDKKSKSPLLDIIFIREILKVGRLIHSRYFAHNIFPL